MRKIAILIIALVALAIGSFAQSYTQKWNDLYREIQKIVN